MSASVTERVNQQQVEDFQRDGVIVLRGLFTDWVETLCAGVEENMRSPSADVRIYRNDDGSGLFFGDYCNWDRFPQYQDFMLNSPAAAIAAELTGSSSIRLFHEHVLVKEPGTYVQTPWHHDQPYYCVDGSQTCSQWLALDPVPKETCAEFIAGSHRWGTWFRPQRFDRTPLNQDDGLSAVPDIDNHRQDYEIKSWDMRPGDAIAFNFLTLHGAPPNSSDQLRRRAFSSRWLGDDCRFAKRGGAISPPFREIELEHGAIMDVPEFPLVIG